MRADLTPMTGAEVAPNIAEIFVADDGVRVQLEIFVRDIPVFQALLPDDWLPEDSGPRPDLSERLSEFARNGLSVRTGSGDILPVEVATIEPRLRVDRASPWAGQIEPYSGRKFPEPPEDPRVIYAELFYPFGAERPDRLVFAPPSSAGNSPAASIGMIVFDRGVAVTDFRFLPAEAALTVDWDDPWYSRFDNPNLRRHHRYPVMVFLYAEPYEVRHEALMRVRDAARMTGLTITGTYLTDAERTALEAELPDLLNARSPMTVDGKKVQPDFVRLSYLRIGPTGLVILEPGEDIQVDAAIVGLIYSTPTTEFAKQATVEWPYFTPEMAKVPGYAIDAAGPFLMDLTPDDPVLTWTNHFKKPPYPEVGAVAFDAGDTMTPAMFVLAGVAVMGAVLVLLALKRPRPARGRQIAAGVGIVVVAMAAIPVVLSGQRQARIEIEGEALDALVADLLGNVYRAFDFKQEDQVYDRLELTLDGDVLERVYLDQRKTLRVERAGGAQARVDNVAIGSVERLEPGGSGELLVRATWQISGTVGHWGHTHRRVNAYEADMRLAPRGGSWKILDLDILSQERLL